MSGESRARHRRQSCDGETWTRLCLECGHEITRCLVHGGKRSATARMRLHTCGASDAATRDEQCGMIATECDRVRRRIASVCAAARLCGDDVAIVEMVISGLVERSTMSKCTGSLEGGFGEGAAKCAESERRGVITGGQKGEHPALSAKKPASANGRFFKPDAHRRIAELVDRPHLDAEDLEIIELELRALLVAAGLLTDRRGIVSAAVSTAQQGT